MKILKTLMKVILSIVLLLVFFIKFSADSTTYLCTEKSSTITSKKLLFLTIEEHHPWTNIWAKTDGNIRYKIPLNESGIYNHIIKKQNELEIYKESEKSIQGVYSKLSNKLSLKMNNGPFEGVCEVLNNHCSNNIMH